MAPSRIDPDTLKGIGDNWPHEEVWAWPDNYRLCFPDHRAEAKFLRDTNFSELELTELESSCDTW